MILKEKQKGEGGKKQWQEKDLEKKTGLNMAKSLVVVVATKQIIVDIHQKKKGGEI